MNGETWIVVGASSSIARAFARAAAAKGHAIVLAGRDLEDLERTSHDVQIRGLVSCQVIAFDALELESHGAFVEACQEAGAGGTLNLFFAVGLMPDQDAIDRDPDLAQQTITATYNGAVSLLGQFAPLLEAQGKGRVVVIGSVAGDRGRLKNYVYGSAKAGLAAYCQGLRARLWRSGVSVTTVKPGFIDTGLTWGLPGMFLVATPEACAQACLKWADKGAETCYFPWFWRFIMLIIQHIPEKIFKRLSI